MTNWDNYFCREYDHFDDIHSEVFSDNGARLGINTFLFAILVDHIEDDQIPFSIKDFETVAIKFINYGCGRIQWAFTREDLYSFLSSFSSNDESMPFTFLDNGNYIANMNVIIGNPNFTKAEEAMLGNDPIEMRKLALFCSLHLSFKTLDKPFYYPLQLEKFAR